METNNSGNINPILPQKIAETKQKSIDVKPTASMPASTPDRVEISKQAKEINSATIGISQLPEVRTAAVETARQRIENNQNIPSYLLAGKMLMED
ncbi:MAG: flagellar biosynthesis anti-sigma factor FlgM [bacterium]